MTAGAAWSAVRPGLDRSFLEWPFFEARHRDRAAALDAWLPGALQDEPHSEATVDAASRAYVRALAAGGWLDAAVAGEESDRLDVRSLCLTREILASGDGLADFAFAMQGLGAGPVSLFGTRAQRQAYLPAVRQGAKIAAFALSEPEAGSDVASIATTARRDGGGWVLDGDKTWISNGGIADIYVVFARTGEAPGARGLSAFLVDAGLPGFTVPERIPVTAPHPLGRLRLDGVRVGADALIGEPGQGFKIAMATLDVFRSTVGAAALGLARRALAEATFHAARRTVFGKPLAEHQMTSAKLAEMAVEVDAAALLVYRAAWTKDQGARVTREAAMAKLFATEAAQRVVDQAVQLFGGHGVVAGHIAERLYRDVRALRIYEGASEIQRLIVAGQVLAQAGLGR